MSIPCFVLVWAYDSVNQIGVSAQIEIKKTADETPRVVQASATGVSIINLDEGVDYEIKAIYENMSGKENVKGIPNSIQHRYIPLQTT